MIHQRVTQFSHSNLGSSVFSRSRPFCLVVLFSAWQIRISWIMTSNFVSSYQYVSEQIVIHVGFVILFTGVVGNTLNIIVFMSLKTFRETSCAFYLTIASFANIIHLLASLLSRILITGYNVDLTLTSSTACKLRQFIAVIAPLMALSSMCFATVDQFVSLTDRWRRWSQRWVAHRLIVVTLVFWCLCNIPVILFHNTTSSASGQRACSIINPDFSNYFSRFYVSYLLGFIQIIVRSSVGLLAFINARHLAHRRIPIVRLERDKQITSMVEIECLSSSTDLFSLCVVA